MCTHLKQKFLTNEHNTQFLEYSLEENFSKLMGATVVPENQQREKQSRPLLPLLLLHHPGKEKQYCWGKGPMIYPLETD